MAYDYRETSSFSNQSRDNGDAAGNSSYDSASRGQRYPRSSYGAQQGSGYESQRSAGYGSQRSAGYGTQRGSGYSTQRDSGYSTQRETVDGRTGYGHRSYGDRRTVQPQGTTRRAASTSPSTRAHRAQGASYSKTTGMSYQPITGFDYGTNSGISMPAGKSGAARIFIIVVAVLVAVLLVAGIAFAARTITSSMNAQDTAAESDTTLDAGGDVVSDTEGEVEEEDNGLWSDKLDGATETVDEDGVVHGTTASGVNYEVRGRGEAALQTDKVTLAACGDQIVSEDCLNLAATNYANSGNGDGYDFSKWYQETGDFVRSYDLRFINPETVTCDTSEQDPAGWPTFISPDSAVDNLADQGYNIFNFASNHIYDYGTDAIIRTHEEEFAKYPGITVVGSYLSEEDAETVHMIERNGITFAFLAYTYADNTYYNDYTEMPNYYYDRPFDEETITADVARAKEVADVVIVCMHWGDEYISEPNSQEYEWAAKLADMDVDLVLGTHAHIMQPVEYITGEETGNTIPVVFGLSDFVSGWTITDTILSGIFTCDFVPQDDGTISVENLMWNPTIEWSDGSSTPYVRFLANMSESEINENTRTPDVDGDYDYLYNMVHSLITEIDTAW